MRHAVIGVKTSLVVKEAIHMDLNADPREIALLPMQVSPNDSETIVYWKNQKFYLDMNVEDARREMGMAYLESYFTKL